MTLKWNKFKRWITEDNTREALAVVINALLILICLFIIIIKFTTSYNINLTITISLLMISLFNIFLQIIMYNTKKGEIKYLIRKFRFGWYSLFIFVFITNKLAIFFELNKEALSSIQEFSLSFFLIPVIIVAMYRNIKSEFKPDIFSNNVFKLLNIIKSKFTYKMDNAYLIIVLFTIYILLLLITFYNPLYTDKLVVILALFVIFASVLLNYNKLYNENIFINFINLDIIKILEKPIYLETSTLKNDFRLFEVDIHELFPKRSFNKQFYVRNHRLSSKDEELMIYLDKFYIAVKIGKSDTIEFDLRIVYQIMGKEGELKTKCKKIKFYIDFQNCENEYIPIKSKVVCIYNKRFNSKKFENRRVAEKNDLETYAPVLYGYQYNDGFLEDHAKKSILSRHLIEGKKWLYHDGKYGVGKSTADVIGVASSGYVPIPISPWEENYSHDFLALIFKRIKKASHKHYFFNANALVFYLVLLVSSILIVAPFVPKISDTTFIDNVLSFYRRFSIFDHIPILGIYLFNLFFIFVILAIALFFVYCFLVPDIILLKKDCTKYYQEFFLKEIDKMLCTSKIVLIIEDIDRMDKEDQTKIFSVLSVINKHCVRTHRYIGIISQNIKIMEKNPEFINFKNKCLLNSIFDNYISEICLEKYLDLVFTYLIQEYKITEKTQVDNLKETLTHCDINFRDIRGIMNKIIDNKYSGKKIGVEDIKNAVNELKKDLEIKKLSS